jgi:hypothetical protein
MGHEHFRFYGRVKSTGIRYLKVGFPWRTAKVTIPMQQISSGSSQRPERPDVGEAEAARAALAHLLPARQSALGEPMQSAQLVRRRQLSAELPASDEPPNLGQ